MLYGESVSINYHLLTKENPDDIFMNHFYLTSEQYYIRVPTLCLSTADVDIVSGVISEVTFVPCVIHISSIKCEVRVLIISDISQITVHCIVFVYESK